MFSVTNGFKFLGCLSALLFCVVPAAASERHLDAHEHGVSSLKIAQDGDRIQFELEAPGNDIVGFEHAAESDAERKAVDGALETLQAPDKLFSVVQDARCKLLEAEAEFETEGDHAGFHVSWTLECRNVAATTSLNFGYFGAFERAREVEVEAFGNAGQSAYEVERDTTTLDLTGVISN